jgi:hypothetical protein
VQDLAQCGDVPLRLEEVPLEAALQVDRVRLLGQLGLHLPGELQLDPQHLAQPRREEFARIRQQLCHRAHPFPPAGPYTHRTGVPRAARLRSHPSNLIRVMPAKGGK